MYDHPIVKKYFLFNYQLHMYIYIGKLQIGKNKIK